jgi:hypothetical protein
MQKDIFKKTNSMKCSFEIVKFNVILGMHHLVFYRLVYGSPGHGIHWVDIAVRWNCSPVVYILCKEDNKYIKYFAIAFLFAAGTYT